MYHPIINCRGQAEEEDQTIILLTSLPKSYETIVTMLLVGKMILIVHEVPTALLETNNI